MNLPYSAVSDVEEEEEALLPNCEENCDGSEDDEDIDEKS